MFSVIGLVIVLIIKVNCYPEEDFNDNGWKPLTSEQVLNLQKKFINPPQTSTNILQWNPSLLAEENIQNTELNTDDKPYDINRELINNIDKIGIEEKQNQGTLTENEQNYNSEYLSGVKTKIIHNHLPTNRRHAKNIVRNQESFYINVLRSDKNINDIIVTDTPEKLKMKETNIKNDKINIYEVSEDSEASEIKDLLNIDQSKTYERKPYFEPNVKTTTEKNLSNILLNILENYNIRINDELTNYALSKNKHSSNTFKQNYGYRVPIRTQPIRNSENYLPLDPFLAVFLSNYGFYLPGYFGYPGNYNNIYGYLASNNIHNNKPFGAYKIYSDTDSSH